MTPTQLVLSKLPDARASGDQWVARCPAHDDSKPSLWVREGDDGRALVLCRANCTTAAVCAAVGLTLRDLMPRTSGGTAHTPTERRAPAARLKPSSKPPKTYPSARAAAATLEKFRGPRSGGWEYRTATGELVGVVVRWDGEQGKDFFPISRFPGGWQVVGMPVPRPLFGLPELAGAGTVLVVEGEGCVEAARVLGFVATTSSGGAQAAAKTDWSPLRAAAEVWVLPDCDGAGERYAADVVAALGALIPAPRVRVLDPRAALGCADPPEGYDLGDALAACTTDADRAALAARVVAVAGATEPVQTDRLVPLATPAEPAPPRAPDWPEPPATEAFHGLAGRFVRAIAPHSEADPAALLVQFLIGAGNVIGRTAHAVADGSRHHANEFAVLVGQSSKARKGTSWARVFEVLTRVDATWARDRVVSGLSSGEGLIWEVRDPAEADASESDQSSRRDPGRADAGVTDKRLLVQESEFASVLRQAERSGNTLSAVLRQAWDGGDLRTLTKNTPARATGAHVSLVGHITREELLQYLTATESANGFGNRFLWLLVRRSQLLPFGGRPDPAEVDALVAELGAVRAFARGAGELGFDAAARNLWREAYPVLSRDVYGLAGALSSRSEAHALRLSVLFAVLDRSVAIRTEHLAAALALWEYSERSVRHLFGGSTGNALADELFELIGAAGATGMTRNELRERAGRSLPAERLDAALGALLRAGLARCESRETRGRPAEVWFATGRTARGN